jgi:hypothetical protein
MYVYNANQVHNKFRKFLCGFTYTLMGKLAFINIRLLLRYSLFPLSDSAILPMGRKVGKVFYFFYNNYKVIRPEKIFHLQRF